VASNITAELDKTFHSTVNDPADDAATYGEMNIRVVVLKKRKDNEVGEDAADLESEEALPSSTKKEIDTYLEDPKRGKECCVFLINGQRQDSWDNTFIVRDLGLKYLRNRMLIIADLDGLKPEAIAEIMQGSRQGFFQGKVFHAISKRLVATLKKDPDLDKLQKEAEQNLLEMKAADAAVKDKLDQLIEGHHAAATADGPGEGDGSSSSGDGEHFTEAINRHDVVVMSSPNVGQDAALPVLGTDPALVAVRLHPDETRVVNVTSLPQGDWANVEQFRAQLQPEVKGLTLTTAQGADRAALTLTFTEPDDMDDEEYPVNTDIIVYARFKGHADTRMLKLPVVVVPPRTKKKRTPRPLLTNPTFLRVVSRQPVKLVPGGPSVHVKLLWDGRLNWWARSAAPGRDRAVPASSQPCCPAAGAGITADDPPARGQRRARPSRRPTAGAQSARARFDLFDFRSKPHEGCRGNQQESANSGPDGGQQGGHGGTRPTAGGSVGRRYRPATLPHPEGPRCLGRGSGGQGEPEPPEGCLGGTPHRPSVRRRTGARGDRPRRDRAQDRGDAGLGSTPRRDGGHGRGPDTFSSLGLRTSTSRPDTTNTPLPCQCRPGSWRAPSDVGGRAR
jgi:hypothetical protein